MKYLIISLFLLIGTFAYSQTAFKMTEASDNNLVTITYYNDDGSIHQVGTLQDNKLHGRWTMYNNQGQITAIANYCHGKKEGTWYFFEVYEDEVVEIQYKSNDMVSVNYSKISDMDI